MKNPFDIKKDIHQLKETWRNIEEKFPLFCSIARSILVIVKWLVGTSLVVLILLIIHYYAVELPKKKKQQVECKKRIVKMVLDPNMYVKDLNSWSIEWKKREQIIDILSFLTKKEPFEIENLIKAEWDRLANRSGWEQMAPLKIKDVIGDIDLKSIDYADPNLLRGYCF